jgi:hypothetical protein
LTTARSLSARSPDAGPDLAATVVSDIALPHPQYAGQVRLTEFWRRMKTQFGEVYADSLAKDFVFANLGGRTIERALAEGVDAKVVWRSVCDQFNVPESLR